MKRSGFTLLEVLISIAFIGIALVAVIRAQGQGITLADEARFTSRAIFLAKLKLAEAQHHPDLTAAEQSGAFAEPLEEFSWDAEINPVTGLPGLYKVQIWVRRTGQKPKQGVMLQGFTYRGTQ